MNKLKHQIEFQQMNINLAIIMSNRRYVVAIVATDSFSVNNEQECSIFLTTANKKKHKKTSSKHSISIIYNAFQGGKNQFER